MGDRLTDRGRGQAAVGGATKRERTVESILVLMALVAVVVAFFCWRRAETARSRIAIACSVMMAFAMIFVLAIRVQRDVKDELRAAIPPTRIDRGYVTSETCRECHADQHASWHRTYHRTMTQLATPENVLAPFDGTTLEIDGQSCRVFRRGDAFWVEMDDPEWEQMIFLDARDTRDLRDRPRAQARIVMTTGSHHFQAYWIRSEYGRELWQFPWRYDLREKQWVHRRDVFLGPPQWRPGMHFKVWNDNCIFCHSTGGQPGLDGDTNYLEHTTVAELGIACEACHGPGEAHVRLHQSSKNKGVSTVAAEQDTIVNPAKLDHERASEVCGSCHANFVHDSPELMATGSAFRPGQRLARFGRFFRPQAEEDDDLVSRFWADGVNRSTGREFMGLKESACYQQGELSCLSCHSMHASQPDDQLAADMESNEACFGCHTDYRQQLTDHTHHPSDSPGSLCYNCHMPHTNYALFKATRSHQVTSPRVVRSITRRAPTPAIFATWTNRSFGPRTTFPSGTASSPRAGHRRATGIRVGPVAVTGRCGTAGGGRVACSLGRCSCHRRQSMAGSGASRHTQRSVCGNTVGKSRFTDVAARLRTVWFPRCIEYGGLAEQATSRWQQDTNEKRNDSCEKR